VRRILNTGERLGMQRNCTQLFIQCAYGKKAHFKQFTKAAVQSNSRESSYGSIEPLDKVMLLKYFQESQFVFDIREKRRAFRNIENYQD